MTIEFPTVVTFPLLHKIKSSNNPTTMKKIQLTAVLVAILFGALPLASAATIYTENWGSPNSSVTGDGNINTVGWTGVAVSQTAGPYMGIYQASGASDPALGLGLPVNTVYFTVLLPNQTTPGMFYTTDTSGSGAGGNSSFTDINPTLYTNLTFNLEGRGGAGDTNYFAVQVGGSVVCGDLLSVAQFRHTWLPTIYQCFSGLHQPGKRLAESDHKCHRRYHRFRGNTQFVRAHHRDWCC